METRKNNVTVFDSMADMAAFMTPHKCHDGGGLSWYGGQTAEQSIKALTIGDMTHVAAAQKMMGKFDIRIETAGQSVGVGVAGFMPCIPEFLGGAPECMYCMDDVVDEQRPIKILVDPTSSAMISAKDMAKRGTTIMAAVMALSAMRPVELETTCMLDCSSERKLANGARFCSIRTKINSAPLDLASACFALCHQGFTRRINYGLAVHLYGAPLEWPSIPGVNCRDTRAESTIAAYLHMLGEPIETTLFIPASQDQDPLVTEPEKWIAAVLEKYGTQAVH